MARVRHLARNQKHLSGGVPSVIKICLFVSLEFTGFQCKMERWSFFLNFLYYIAFLSVTFFGRIRRLQKGRQFDVLHENIKLLITPKISKKNHANS